MTELNYYAIYVDYSIAIIIIEEDHQNLPEM